jgi:ubiquinone/menaquinone biosynthesis C-methylase UbiE
LPQKYSSAGKDPQHLYGDATDLYWFKDNVLDYIYSSHLLEDFPDTRKVLREWMRVLKPGGLMMLCLPHEMRFREHCDRTGQVYNIFHQCKEMSLEHMKPIFTEVGLETIFEQDQIGAYCFIIVGRKLPSRQID